mmetsp:Transcript_66638/g.104157  ORF Transcript_66638/g.104157 Transcript_66638/m.104157 type:complete len:986 (+) Transcript_66638:60-3017(+)
MANSTDPDICEPGGGGVILPLFGDEEQSWHKPARGIIYGVALGWFFLGVSIIADIFMGGIEAVTSKRRQHVLENGQTVTVKVWNGTVANLTLMALGSSAPEILLNVIEILANSFFSGELGPSTIIGSAAFNMLMIIAICVAVIPSGEARTIQQFEPFLVTAVFSVFAYLWLALVLGLTTPDVVTPGEGIATFLFFPLLVVLAYLADIGCFSRSKQAKLKNEEEEMKANLLEAGYTINKIDAQALVAAKHDSENVMKSHAARRAASQAVKVISPKEVSVGFLSKKYCFNENADSVMLEIEKVGTIGLDMRVGVQFRSYSGALKVGSSTGYVEILAGSKYAQAIINVNPSALRSLGNTGAGVDLEAKESNNFFVDIVHACKLASTPSAANLEEEIANEPHLKVNVLPDYRTAQVEIMSMKEDVGRLRFDKPMINIPGPPVDTVEQVTVTRFNGSEGELRCRYATEPDTAQPNYDYTHVEDELIFAPGVMSREISINIHKKNSWEVSDRFYVVLSNVDGCDSAVDEDNAILGVTISCDKAKGVANQILRVMDSHLNLDALGEGTSQWKMQWVAALRPNGGDEDELKEASAFDWVFHLVSLPWKLIFALVPPPVYCQGWACFFVALIMIGGVTAFIGDLAGLLGCVMGLKPKITAITIVAVGTSLPDAFASKVAAIDDPGADNAIGNVTGSNSVNVFLGIGLPWMAASLYWHINGIDDEWLTRYPEIALDYPDGGFVVIAGDLVFSVIVFTIASLAALAVIMYRRRTFKAELGGPDGAKMMTCIFFVLLWFFYVGLAVWKILAGEQSTGMLACALASGILAVVFGMLLITSLVATLGNCRQVPQDVKKILDHLDAEKRGNIGGLGGNPLSMANIQNPEEHLSKLKDHIAGLNAYAASLESSIKNKSRVRSLSLKPPVSFDKQASETSGASDQVQITRKLPGRPKASSAISAQSAPPQSFGNGIVSTPSLPMKAGFKKKMRKKEPTKGEE